MQDQRPGFAISPLFLPLNVLIVFFLVFAIAYPLLWSLEKEMVFQDGLMFIFRTCWKSTCKMTLPKGAGCFLVKKPPKSMAPVSWYFLHSVALEKSAGGWLLILWAWHGSLRFLQKRGFVVAFFGDV